MLVTIIMQTHTKMIKTKNYVYNISFLCSES